MAIKCHNAIQFIDKLSQFDGEAKWYVRNGDVFIASATTNSDTFPKSNCHDWQYAFSDEPECIDWELMGFEPPPEELLLG